MTDIKRVLLGSLPQRISLRHFEARIDKRKGIRKEAIEFANLQNFVLFCCFVSRRGKRLRGKWMLVAQQIKLADRTIPKVTNAPCRSSHITCRLHIREVLFTIIMALSACKVSLWQGCRHPFYCTSKRACRQMPHLKSPYLPLGAQRTHALPVYTMSMQVMEVLHMWFLCAQTFE